MAHVLGLAVRCCLLILLCGTDGRRAPREPLTDADWKILIHNVVHQLYPQRGDRDQFGFILVDKLAEVTWSEELPLMRMMPNGVPRLERFNPRHSLGAPGPRYGPWVDNGEVSPSNLNMYINYVTARPKNISEIRTDPRRSRLHSEELLLDELEDLVNRHHNTRGYMPDLVILYTWFAPCNCCRADIISKRTAPVFRDFTWIIAYSKNLTSRGRHVNNNQRTRPRPNAPTYTVNIDTCQRMFAGYNITFVHVECEHIPPSQVRRQQSENVRMEMGG